MSGLYRKKILWRDTMRKPRLTIFDARLIFFLLLLAIHLALWTLFLLLMAVIVFWLVERAGYRLPSALRVVRASLAGTLRPARAHRQYRVAVDYGFEWRAGGNETASAVQARFSSSRRRDGFMESKV